jgi:tryptophan-rich hypothetical protein
MAGVRLNPAKLLRSKWTACVPANKEKHFMVVALLQPDPAAPIDTVTIVTIEAVHSGRRFDLPWRALCDAAVWRQGWA